MGGGGRANEGGAKEAKRASSADAQRARGERRVSFAVTAEVCDMANSNTALERSLAFVASELAKTASRQEVAAGVRVEALHAPANEATPQRNPSEISAKSQRNPSEIPAKSQRTSPIAAGPTW